MAQFDVKSDDESEGEKSDEFSAENDLEPIDPEEEAQVEQFMPSNRHAVRTLGDVIREKISEKQIEQSAAFSGKISETDYGINLGSQPFPPTLS